MTIITASFLAPRFWGPRPCCKNDSTFSFLKIGEKEFARAKSARLSSRCAREILCIICAYILPTLILGTYALNQHLQTNGLGFLIETEQPSINSEVLQPDEENEEQGISPGGLEGLAMSAAEEAISKGGVGSMHAATQMRMWADSIKGELAKFMRVFDN